MHDLPQGGTEYTGYEDTGNTWDFPEGLHDVVRQQLEKESDCQYVQRVFVGAFVVLFASFLFFVVVVDVLVGAGKEGGENKNFLSMNSIPGLQK